MKTRRRVLVCLAFALAMVFWQSSRRPFDAGMTGATIVMQPAVHASKLPEATVARLPVMHWSRPEAAKYLTHYFSKELLGVELELEQQRYRGQYWQAEPGLAELQSLEIRRNEAVRRLTVEMNTLLADMCPGQEGEPLELSPAFSPDHPAPNLTFLSDASREKMEALLLARDPAHAMDPMSAAVSVLTGQELADYARWNAPQSAALRNRLAGFDASEQEFSAILEWQATAGSDRESAARAELAERLGAGRLAQLDRLADPAIQTAIQDLRRLGQPLDQAGWLADFRREAAVQMQGSWGNPRLTAADKEREVGMLRSAFRDELAARIGLDPEATELLP